MGNSPLRNAQASSVSVCGKMLRAGQAILVADTAIGPRERKLVETGKIRIRSSNELGKVQITCTLAVAE
jgi:hypothetical protein